MGFAWTCGAREVTRPTGPKTETVTSLLPQPRDREEGAARPETQSEEATEPRSNSRPHALGQSRAGTPGWCRSHQGRIYPGASGRGGPRALSVIPAQILSEFYFLLLKILDAQ